MVAPAEREVLTWETFGEASRALAQQVADSGYRPNIILGIARGGLLPAAAMAYALDVKNVFMMSVEFYTGVDERLDLPVMLPHFSTPSTSPGPGSWSSTTSPIPAGLSSWSKTSAPNTSPMCAAPFSMRSLARLSSVSTSGNEPPTG